MLHRRTAARLLYNYHPLVEVSNVGRATVKKVLDPQDFNLQPKDDEATAALYKPWNGGVSPFDERTALDRSWGRLQRLHPQQPQTFRNVVVTVFGCNGFLGNHIVKAFVTRGARVICPIRLERRSGYAPPQQLARDFQLGSTHVIVYDPTSFDEMLSLTSRSHIVVNCIGRRRKPGLVRGDLAFGYEAVYQNLPRMVARAAAMSNVDRFIHISHVNSHPQHWCKALKYKGLGDEAVRDEFPGATIVRPCDVFGFADKFLYAWFQLMQHAQARVPLPVPHKRVQPVNVSDFAWAIQKMAAFRHTTGRTYELGGPTEYTMIELIKYLNARIYRYLEVPIIDYVPWLWRGTKLPEFFVDEMYNDTVADPSARSWEELEMNPADLTGIEQQMQHMTMHATGLDATFDRYYLP